MKEFQVSITMYVNTITKSLNSIVVLLSSLTICVSNDPGWDLQSQNNQTSPRVLKDKDCSKGRYDYGGQVSDVKSLVYNSWCPDILFLFDTTQLWTFVKLGFSK